ncbi:MAG TPA: aminoacyl--tRNA ligase-related protein, partial [Candidatus Paceibacterota bacterium]|nr:aminoacyl--tRNA ligase-related protein [Candidatus Paceibacterota bacterium]
LGFTHEEPITALMKNHIRSFRDLPAYPYQIQTKFRNETRAKSGIMRGREFLMKDLYSFSRNEAEHEKFYEKAKQAYQNIFARVGTGEQTFITFASGGSFSKFSHEFQTICDAGEDIIYVSREKKIAVNKEVYLDEVLAELGLKKETLEEVKAVEVGNIFSLGTRFSDALGLSFTDESGEEKPVVMGSYGVGPNRLMGTVVELLADKKGLVWPKEIAPFQVHLVALGVKDAADRLYEKLQSRGVEVLYDDREGASAGEKFSDSDLFGIPYRLVMSGKTESSGKLEFKERTKENTDLLSEEEVLAILNPEKKAK